MKATYKGRATDKYDRRYTTLFYEYKGFEYSVVAPNTWNCSSDYLDGGYNSLRNQHLREQKRIDDMLARPDITPPRGTFDEIIERVWNMMEEYEEGL